MKTRVRKVNPVIELDESGRLVLFTIPFAGLWYDYDCVSLAAQDKIDDTMDELIEAFYLRSEN